MGCAVGALVGGAAGSPSPRLMSMPSRSSTLPENGCRSYAHLKIAITRDGSAIRDVVTAAQSGTLRPAR